MIADATPWYGEAHETISKHDPLFVLAKLDAIENKVFTDKIGIRGFSSLLYYNSKKIEFTVGRTKDTIFEWALKKSRPPSNELTCVLIKKKAEGAAVKIMVGFFR